jgi:alpha-beta hydrolase superfamily lysophospholipase
MSTYEGVWQSQDGLRLFYRGWNPGQSIKAVVCLVHGLGEYCGRYQPVAEFLNENDYALLGFDLRGHGKSEGIRGHTPSFEFYMRDIDLLIREANQRYPSLPCILYGHSLGGLLVLSYALERQPPLRGVIASGPGLRTSFEQQKVKIAVAQVGARFFPEMRTASGLNPGMLSRDQKIVEAYISDPLVHNQVTFSMAKASLDAIPWVFKHANEFKIPLLLMQGEADQIVYPSGAQEFASKIPGNICTLKLWPGLAHEIHNEPEKEMVLNFLLNWMNSLLETSPWTN